MYVCYRYILQNDIFVYSRCVTGMDRHEITCSHLCDFSVCVCAYGYSSHENSTKWQHLDQAELWIDRSPSVISDTKIILWHRIWTEYIAAMTLNDKMCSGARRWECQLNSHFTDTRSQGSFCACTVRARSFLGMNLKRKGNSFQSCKLYTISSTKEWMFLIPSNKWLDVVIGVHPGLDPGKK